MPRAFLRFLLVLLACCPLLATGAGQPRHILDLDVKSQMARLLDWGDAWVDQTGQLELQSVLRRTAEFKPTLTEGLYDVGPGQTLWITFTVPPTPDDQRWYVRLRTPGLDLVTLYTLGHDDAWTQQRAGDLLPVSQWALPHLQPVLPLAISAADPTHYVLRIQASDGVRAPIEFLSESRLSAEQQRVSLVFGVYFGLLVMGAVYALVSGVVLRDAGYLWFGVWSLAAMLAAATAVGVAGMHFWPEAPEWSDAAQYVLPSASAVPFLVFMAHGLLLRDRAIRLYITLVALALACGVAAVAAGALGSPARYRITVISQALAVCAGVGTLLWSWYRGDTFARNLFGALLPLGIALPLHFGRVLEVSTDGMLHLVVPLGGLAVSLIGTYLLLSLRSQGRRDHRRRIAQLHEFDPTTGLVNDVMFARRLQELIERARKFDHQSVAAVVDFTNLQALREEFGRKHSLELLLRLAERLSSMMRSMDTVARLGDSRFGLLVDGPVGPSRAKAMCAKVIAHCITPLSGLPQGMVVRPKVALVLVPAQCANVQQVMGTLDELLRDASNDRARVILMPPMPTDDSRAFTSTGMSMASSPDPSQPREAGPESSTNFPSTVLNEELEKIVTAQTAEAVRTAGPAREPEGFESLISSELPSLPATESLPYGVSLPPADSSPL
jgi:diguanylate cyclase (GGDEF)-like protein